MTKKAKNQNQIEFFPFHSELSMVNDNKTIHPYIRLKRDFPKFEIFQIKKHIHIHAN